MMPKVLMTYSENCRQHRRHHRPQMIYCWLVVAVLYALWIVIVVVVHLRLIVCVWIDVIILSLSFDRSFCIIAIAIVVIAIAIAIVSIVVVTFIRRTIFDIKSLRPYHIISYYKNDEYEVLSCCIRRAQRKSAFFDRAEDGAFRSYVGASHVVNSTDMLERKWIIMRFVVGKEKDSL